MPEAQWCQKSLIVLVLPACMDTSLKLSPSVEAQHLDQGSPELATEALVSAMLQAPHPWSAEFCVAMTRARRCFDITSHVAWAGKGTFHEQIQTPLLQMQMVIPISLSDSMQ